MSTTEIVTLAISAVSLVVAVVAAYKAYLLSRDQLRLGSRTEFLKILIDIDQELIRDPILWAIFDTHPLSARRDPGDLLQAGRLEAGGYAILNFCDLVYSFYHDTLGLPGQEREQWEMWDATIQDFLATSALLRGIVQGPTMERVHTPQFVNSMRICIERIRIEEGAGRPV